MLRWLWNVVCGLPGKWAHRLRCHSRAALLAGVLVVLVGSAAGWYLWLQRSVWAAHDALHLRQIAKRLYELADPERGITVNVGIVSGGQRANVVAPEAQAELDIRVLATEDARRLERTVLDLAPVTPGTALEVLGGIDRPALEATPGNRILWEAACRCAEDLGIPLAEGTAGGASDGSLTSRFVPTLDGLGAVGDGAHALHEHVLVDRMPERAALLALLLLEEG